MNKWKYKIESVKLSIFKGGDKHAEIMQERLTRLGMEGWELVTVSSDSSMSGFVILYLKRPY